MVHTPMLTSDLCRNIRKRGAMGWLEDLDIEKSRVNVILTGGLITYKIYKKPT